MRHVQCLDARGLHRMAYWEWGDAAQPSACWSASHGVSRQGRDFDTLARAMRGEYRVVCPDVVGRGESDWLADPMGYALPAYVADMVTLLARLDARQRALGRHLDGRPDRHGPRGAARLADRAPGAQRRRPGDRRGRRWRASAPTSASRSPGRTQDEAADYLLTISQGFGPHTREQWLALTRPMLRRDGERLPPALRPGDRRAAARRHAEMAAAGEAALWAALRRDPLPDAAAARRRVRPARARDRRRR